MTCIYLSSCPFIDAESVLAAIGKITFIFLMIAKNQFSFPILEVICPLSVIDVSIGIFVDALIALVVAKSASEGITIEKNEITFNFLISHPSTIEHAALSKEVCSLSIFLPLFEAALIDVLIGILQNALSMRQVVEEVPLVSAAIFVAYFSFSILVILLEFTFIGVAFCFIEKRAFAFFFAISPASVIILFSAAKLAQSVLQVVFPFTFIVSRSFVVVVYAVSIF